MTNSITGSQFISSSSSICLFLSHSCEVTWSLSFWCPCLVLNDPSAVALERLQGHEVELFSLSHGLGERCSAIWREKKPTLALERNESSGANPCPTCAQMYGWWKSYYLLILPWLDSPVQICCLLAVSLLSHVFRSSQHRTMLDYVVYIETLSSCQCNQGPNLGPHTPQDAPSVLHLNVGGLVEWELPIEQ